MLFNSFAVAMAALALPYTAIASEADDARPPIVLPCTAKSPSMGFYDLRPIMVPKIDENAKQTGKEKTNSWQSKGHDYNGNFSINFCAPVVEEIADVVGIEKNLWQNVSAYYERDGQVFSIGQESTNLTVRGRKLVLQYTNGSPCGPDATSKTLFGRDWDNTNLDVDEYSDLDISDYNSVDKENDRFKYHDADIIDNDDDNDDDKESKKPKEDNILRKSATISFHCERDPLKALAVASFVGVDPSECAYFFEVRSPYACAGSEPVELGGVGPGGVFGIIGLIAIVVYFAGGVVYNRNVAHQRGWRQLPNYAMWAGIGGFLKDMAIILFSSCTRCLPGRSSRGYSAIAGTGRNRRPDDENRLIDNLDEEWDD